VKRRTARTTPAERSPDPALLPVSDLVLPRNLTESAQLRGRTAWLRTLPAVLEHVREHLELDSVGEAFQPGGQTAWVAPVHSPAFGDAVLKVAARHDEAADEAQGLRVWNGSGAVRLFTSEDIDAHTTVLLLERCRPGNWLTDEPEETQDQVVAGLLRRLWVDPPPTGGFRPLSEMCEQWAAASDHWAESQGRRVDRGLVRAGIDLFRALASVNAPQRLLCTDLHAENVLAAEREPWLMVDPKPYVGDPAYDPLQHIINGAARFGREPKALSDRMAALTGLDPQHLRLWLFARCVVGAAAWPELLAVARQVAPG
jgi:streptomycin 6-kinase